jgi:hypothetical protein
MTNLNVNIGGKSINIDEITEGFRQHGNYPKENCYDYKVKLNTQIQGVEISDYTQIFMENFAKDIISMHNGDGGILFLGINDDANSSNRDVGLDSTQASIMKGINLGAIAQKFDRLCKNIKFAINSQEFPISGRVFYYISIGKGESVAISMKDEYTLKKGEIWYRGSGKNELANEDSQSMNCFLEKKAKEKSDEHMKIWSQLLPELIEINPKKSLIINLENEKVYGFNSDNKKLLGVSIDIKDNLGLYQILNCISAGEIGEISKKDGKPIYTIVGSISNEDRIPFSSVLKKIQEKAQYSVTDPYIKMACKYLGWVTKEKFKIERPIDGTINDGYKDYLRIETMDASTKSNKIFFSENAVTKLLEVVNNPEEHTKAFGKHLTAVKKTDKSSEN